MVTEFDGYDLEQLLTADGVLRTVSRRPLVTREDFWVASAQAGSSDPRRAGSRLFSALRRGQLSEWVTFNIHGQGPRDIQGLVQSQDALSTIKLAELAVGNRLNKIDQVSGQSEKVINMVLKTVMAEVGVEPIPPAEYTGLQSSET